MLALVVIVCMCGTKLKVMYDTGENTTVRCPTSPCRTKHIVPGQVTKLWIESSEQVWKPLAADHLG